MANNRTIGTKTTLIDSTTDDNYIYIGATTIFNDQQPLTNKKIWEIQRITKVDGKATKIENAWPDKPTASTYFAWDDRTTLTYK